MQIRVEDLPRFKQTILLRKGLLHFHNHLCVLKKSLLIYFHTATGGNILVIGKSRPHPCTRFNRHRVPIPNIGRCCLRRQCHAILFLLNLFGQSNTHTIPFFFLSWLRKHLVAEYGRQYITLFAGFQLKYSLFVENCVIALLPLSLSAFAERFPLRSNEPYCLIALFFFIRVVRVIRMLKATSQFISATSGGGLVYNTQIVSHKEE